MIVSWRKGIPQEAIDALPGRKHLRTIDFMRAVMSFSQRLAVLVSGKKIADGKPDDVIKDQEVIGAYLGQ